MPSPEINFTLCKVKRVKNFQYEFYAITNYSAEKFNFMLEPYGDSFPILPNETFVFIVSEEYEKGTYQFALDTLSFGRNYLQFWVYTDDIWLINGKGEELLSTMWINKESYPSIVEDDLNAIRQGFRE